jgi:glycosyltransferase involved in cell wall biosynthesis
MADAIRRLAADPEWAMELGRAGRSAVGRLFSRDRIEPMMAELYRSVALSRAELS